MIAIAIISGLTAVLTPNVFPLLLISILVFENFSNSKKQGFINIAIFSCLIIGLFPWIINEFIAQFSPSNTDNHQWEILINNILQLSFASLLLYVLIKKVHLSDTKFLKHIIRYLGISALSLSLILSSFSCIGPIIGSLLIESTATDNNQLEVLFFFAIGLIIPFVMILSIFNLSYQKLKHKKWWRISQYIAASLLLISSMFSTFYIVLLLLPYNT